MADLGQTIGLARLGEGFAPQVVFTPALGGGAAVLRILQL